MLKMPLKIILVNADFKQNVCSVTDLTCTASSLILKDIFQMWNDSSDAMICSWASTELPNSKSMCPGYQHKKGDTKKL